MLFAVRVSTSPADRTDWSYALGIMGERDLFDEDGGDGPASCCPKLLPKKEVCWVYRGQTTTPWCSGFAVNTWRLYTFRVIFNIDSVV